MSKRCFSLVLLAATLAVAQGDARGAFDPLKDPSLVGWWSFDEGTGTIATDSSPYGRDGTLNGGATWAPGRFGGGIQLDGTSGYVSVPNFQLTTDAITMVAWVNGWKANNWAALVTGHPARLEMCFGDNNTLHYAWNNDSATTWSWAGAPVIPQDTWAMVAMTIDTTKAVAYVYTDDAGLNQGTNEIAHVQQTYSTLQIGWSFDNRYVRGILDEVAVYSRALTQEEMQILAKGPQDPARAGDPSPADEAIDVPFDTSFGWKPGETATAHDVYVGTSFEDVNNASRATPMDLLASQGQAANTFDPGRLELGATYYWRIDEADAAGATVKGDVWSFTVEPFAYPITPVTATASSAQPNMGPQNTINGSGLSAGDEHSTELTQMWMSAGVQPNWIQYEFDTPYKLDELWVWNSNQMIEPFIGFGAKNVTIEYAMDGATWTALEGVPEFAQADGTATYTANTVVDLGGITAKYIKLTIDSTWGGVAPQTGLAEVRFFYIPVQAREPQPADDATEVSVDADLNWRPGREAGSHDVYFGADANALTLVDTVTEHGYTPAVMDFGTTYSWKVNEVGDTGTYEGEVWSFTTEEYAIVDDFESYNDDDNRIYDSWIDGLTDAAKGGSQVGYDVSPFAEKTIIHDGKQSMPLLYDNSAAPFVSEAERSFDTAQNWTTNGADSLVVHFRGVAPAFAETASGNIVMNGIGTDIWNNGDQFRFAYKTLNGNGTMIARVESIIQSDVWAKGGVMIRQGIEPGSTHAFMPITPSGGNGASFQRRLAANGASTNNDSTTVVRAPYWVKIERNGNNFTGSISPDGVTWAQLGTAQTITMTNPVLIGLALCSHSATVVTSAEFSNISTTGNVTGNWQVAEIGIEPAFGGAGNSVEGLYVSVTDSAGKTKVVQNPDAAATANVSWQQWVIPLTEFTSAGVKANAVKTMTIGVGNKAAPKAGGAGIVYIDDVGYGRSLP